MQCVILAGGLGTRIRARSADLPQALIPVLGRPFIDYQLEWLARQGVRSVVLSIGHLGAMIAAAVGDGARFGLSVVYADEGDRLRGTGGALRLAADLGLLDRSFFLLYGDSYLPIDLAPVWRTSEAGQVCTMTVLRNRGRWDRSNALIRPDGALYYDKTITDPVAAGMDYIDYGLSVLRRDVVLEEIAPDVKADIADAMHRLSVRGQLRAHEVSERFYERGSGVQRRDGAGRGPH
jgi:N-acetyl-alpha-D-muramate 1-phosphate uridylyltransferase